MASSSLLVVGNSLRLRGKLRRIEEQSKATATLPVTAQ
jgi:hypothetical protein